MVWSCGARGSRIHHNYRFGWGGRSRVFRERLNEIDLVMLDFAMPKMNGVEAFGELIRIKPDVKVILCSGYTEDVVLESFPDQRPAGVLHKPYKMEALKAELERLLETLQISRYDTEI